MNTKKLGRRSQRRPEIEPQNRLQFFGADIITDLRIQQQAASNERQEVLRLEYGDSKLIEELGYERWLELARKRHVPEEDRERLIQSGKRSVTFAMAGKRFERLTADQKNSESDANDPAAILRKLQQTFSGAVLLPIPLGEKGPKEPNWQKISYEATQSEPYQNKLLAAIARGGNIGVVLGPHSGRLFALDIDDDSALKRFVEDFPWLAGTLRSRAQRGCQFWLRLEADSEFPNEQAVRSIRNARGHPIGELRLGGAGGAQSVIWGLHPKGMRYAIVVDEEIVEISLSDLYELCTDLSQTKEPEPETEPPKAEQERPARKLRGTSIIDFAERSVDHSRVLLGNRWLERGQGAFVIAPSGHGKSTLVIQAAICWSCARVAFAIKPAKPWRFLVLQSEDSDNDIVEMAQMVHRLDLTEKEKALVRANTHVEWLNDVAGEEFFKVLEDFLTQYRPDILVINPLTAFLGGDVQDTGLTNEFLRIRLAPLLNKFDCGTLPVHHTTKTQNQDREKFSWFDWMYNMAGGATLTNWARAVLVVFPTDLPGTYRFIAARRFEKIGWAEREYWFAHSLDSDDRMLWVPASHEQIAGAQPSVRRASPSAILELIPAVDPISQEKLWILASEKLHVGKNAARDLVNILLEDREIFQHKIPREGAKAAVGYAKTPPPEE